MEKLIHHATRLCGQTASWWPTDTKELYEKNLHDPQQRVLLEKFGWINTDIVYVNNSHGFRTVEFDRTENFIAVGCSFTYGIGLPQHSVWPELLSQQLNIPAYNLGIPGSSADTCYRVVKHYVPLLKPKFVVMLEPRRNRLEIFLDNYQTHVYQSGKSHPLDRDLWIKHWQTCEKNQAIQAEKNRDAMAHVCHRHGIDFYYYEEHYYNDPEKFFPGIGLSLSRDLQHLGVSFNQHLADKMFKDITTQTDTYE